MSAIRADMQPKELDLVNFVAPRGAVKCARAQRKRARAENSLAAAPGPHVAGVERASHHNKSSSLSVSRAEVMSPSLSGTGRCKSW